MTAVAEERPAATESHETSDGSHEQVTKFTTLMGSVTDRPMQELHARTIQD